MPGKTQRTMGMNRMAKHRKSVQEDLVSTLLDNDSLADMTFGVIQKHNGNGQLTVLIPSKDGRKEARALLRGLLGKCNIKNVFPTGSIVALGIRSFETTSNTFDVMASIDRKDAKKLVTAERIPKWMLTVADGAEKDLGIDSFEFDYEEEEDEEGVSESKIQKEREKGKSGKRLDVVEEELDIDAI